MIFRRQLVGGIHRRMRRHFQDQQFAGTQQQDLAGHARLVRRQRLGQELAQHRIQRAHVAQGLADQGTGETGIAGFKPGKLFQLRIQRTALLQNA